MAKFEKFIGENDQKKEKAEAKAKAEKVALRQKAKEQVSWTCLVVA